MTTVIGVLTCLISLIITLTYEGKSILLLGKNNYKVQLGSFKNFDEEIKQNFFPPLTNNIKKTRYMKSYIIFFIPIINIIYAIIKGNKKYNDVITRLNEKNIIVKMNDKEIKEYSEINSKASKISFVLFNSIHSYKKSNITLVKDSNEYKLENNNKVSFALIDYYKNKEKIYEKDIDYLTEMFNFKKEEEKIKQLKKY